MPSTWHALLDENLDAAIGHFEAKIVAQGVAPCEPLRGEPRRAIQAAQVLIGLLVRRERYRDAMQISLQHLSGVAPDQVVCPSLFQLCQLAGDSARLKELARAQGDLLSFAAGTIQM
jgi:hypothetical protein